MKVSAHIANSSRQPAARRACSGFTMVEIAISLAVIGIGLVAIIGSLPQAMSVQKENREETVINQDATILMEAIRNGARGLDDLTNYVYAITIYWTKYDANGNLETTNSDGYSYQSSKIIKFSQPPIYPITNGLRIIGLLSMPKYTDLNFDSTNNLYSGGYSNRVIAYVRSMSGLATEKPPQDNDIVVDDSFGYRLVCENAPVQTAVSDAGYGKQTSANLHELRLTFLWPQRPNGSFGAFRQTFRTLIAGQIQRTNDTSVSPSLPLYFFQSQSFTNAP